MIASYAGAAFIIAGFAFLLSRLGLVDIAADVRRNSRASLEILRNAAIDDDAKEAAMQASARILFAGFCRLTIGLGFALVAPLALVWLVALTGLVNFGAILSVSLTWPFLLGGLILFLAVIAMERRRQTSS